MELLTLHPQRAPSQSKSSLNNQLETKSTAVPPVMRSVPRLALLVVLELPSRQLLLSLVPKTSGQST